MKRKVLFSLLLIVVVALVLTASQKANAQGPFPGPCPVNPTPPPNSVPCLTIVPQEQTNLTPGGTVTASVVSLNMPTFSGWDIAMKTNNAVLNPQSLTVMETFGGTFQSTTNCINGSGLGCSGNDGAGIAHSAGFSFGANDAGNKTLFTVTYSVVAAPATDITYVNSPSEPSSVTDPSGFTLVDCSATPNQCLTGSASVAGGGFDYSLSNNGPVTIAQGGSGPVTITAKLTSGSAQSVTLSCATPLPSGIICNSFNPTSVTPTAAGATSVLTIGVGSSVAAGSYTVMVTGSPLGATSTATSVSVTVTGKDGTSTSVGNVSCNIALGASSCTASVTATVADTTTASNAPTGTVTFSLTAGTTGGSLGSPTCTLSTSSGVTSCSVTFTGTASGSGSVTAMYGGDSTHNTSTSTTATVTVTATGKDNTSTSVACSPTTIVPTGTSTCAATVTDTTTASNVPGGSLSFTSSDTTVGTVVASCSLTGGSCTVAFTGVASGSATVTGTYTGDSTHNGSTGTSNTITVAKDNTSTSVGNVSCNIALSASSCTASVTATVADTTTASNTPTGTVTFTLTAGTTGGSLSSNTCNLSSGSCSIMFIGTAAGSGSVIADYGGDSTHNTSTSAAATVTVTATGKDDTSTSVGNVSCNIALGDNSCTASVTATVTDTTTASSIPSGTVTFTLTAGGTGGSLTAGTCTLSAGTCSVMFTGTTAGSGSITATYGGDPTHNTSTSSAATVTVTVTGKDNTSTSVPDVTCNIALGGSSCTASVTATVTDTTTASNAPTGSVTFTLTPGTTGGSLGSTTCSLSTTSGVTSCSVTFTGTASGSGSITASYGGDSSHNTSTSTAATVTVTVAGKDDTSTSVGNVSCNIALGAISCTVSVAATVADTTAVSNTPTGTVTFTLTAGTTGGSLSSNTCDLSSGSCSVTFTSTAAGSGSITAMYGGDSTHNTSTSAAASVTVTATSAPFDYSLSSSGPVTIQAVSSGTATITATLTSGTSQPVTLSCATPLSTGITCGSFTVNPVTPTGSSDLTITVASSVAAGSYSVMVTGSPLGATTTATAVTVMVTTVPPRLHPTTTVVTCSPGSVIINVATSCTARVIDTSTSPTTPTGIVDFTTNSSGVFSPSTSCILSAGAGPNMASCSVSYTPTVAGHQMITGSYGGDSGHSSSTDSFTVNARSPPPGKQTLLTFKGFDLDDFDNGVGQLQVFVNGQLVADIPAGLNHLSGSGDFTAYTDKGINFGPFDTSALLVSGQNNVTFTDPLSAHSGKVRNVRIVQGTSTLLNVRSGADVYQGHSVTYTFSVPPIAITGLAASIQAPVANQNVVFTATYTDGTAPFTCVFSFGDGEHATVSGSNGSCSVTHDYDTTGVFTARVTIIGSSTSDRVSTKLSLRVF